MMLFGVGFICVFCCAAGLIFAQVLVFCLSVSRPVRSSYTPIGQWCGNMLHGKNPSTELSPKGFSRFSRMRALSSTRLSQRQGL